MLILFVLLAQIVIEALPVLPGAGPRTSSPGTIGSEPGRAGDLARPVRVDLHRPRCRASSPSRSGSRRPIYLEEYASADATALTRLILVNIRNLAGVPAVIYGVLGLIIFVQWLEPVTVR